MLSSHLMTAPSTRVDSTGQPFSAISRRWRLIIFCLFAALLYGLGIFWGLPSILSPASDSPAPLSPLNWIARYRDTSVSYIYPPVHQLLCLAAYGVVLLGWKIAGGIGAISKAYPYGFRHPTLVFSSLLLVTNLLSLAMGLGILVCMRFFRLTRTAGAWYAMSLLGLSGVFAYYARVGNLDVPYMFWVVLSWLFVWRYIFSKPNRKLLVFAAIAGALAIGTKDQAVGVVFGLGLTLLSVSPERPPHSIRARTKTAFWFGCSLFLTYAVTSIAVNPWRWWAHISFVTSDHVLPEYPASLLGQWHVLLRSMIRMSHILSPGGLLLGVLGFALLVRMGLRREAAVLFIPPAAYYVSIIMRVRATEERYLLPAAFALALAAGVAAGESLNWARHMRVARYAVAAVLAAIVADQAIQGFIPVTYCQLFDTRRALAKDLPLLVPTGAPLLIVGMNSFNIPDSRVYERYSLMLPPDKRLTPPSSHGEHMLKPYDPQYRYILAGSTLAGEAWPPVGRLVRDWSYPAWLKSRVYVPAVYEFALYQRNP
jgi:hypothetical protein